MAWPWLFESNFEQGTNAEWAAEVDTNTKLDFPHYSILANSSNRGFAPYRGAYCMRVELGGVADLTSPYVRAIAASAAPATTIWFRWQMLVGGNALTVGTTNTFTVLRYMGGATTTVIASVGFRTGRTTAAGLGFELGVGNSVPTVFHSVPFTLNQWHTIELAVVTASDATSVDSSNTLYLDGLQSVQVPGTLQTVAPTQLRLGVLDVIASNTGTILFDSFIADDTRLGFDPNPISETIQGTKSQHIFV